MSVCAVKRWTKQALAEQLSLPCLVRYHSWTPGGMGKMMCPVCDKPCFSTYNHNFELDYNPVTRHLMRHTKQQLEAACLVQTMVLS